MRPTSRRPHLLGGALAVLLAVPPWASAQDALALARLSLVERKVELSKKGATWQAAVEGGPVQIGEAVRTGPESVTRLELPWMALTLGPGSVVRFPDSFLLSASLESGRALVEAQGRDALKIVTPEAEVQGQGRAVVRRQRQETLVTCLAGRFYVHGGDATVTLAAGRGTGSGPGRTPSTSSPGNRSSCAGTATPPVTSSSSCQWARMSFSSSETSRPRPLGSRSPGKVPSAGASRPAPPAASRASPPRTASSPSTPSNGLRAARDQRGA
jgi:hypothetical protein